MSDVNVVTEMFKNGESPFTELLSLLIWHKNSREGHHTLAYTSDELKAIHQHTDNAIEVLLQGLQDLGQLLSMVAHKKKGVIKDLHNIGFFISTITNLTEALNTLRLDTDYVLRQRGDINY